MASKREINKELKRQALLDAAAKEFSQKSYYGTNCAQIALTAKVAVGTIYELFADKKDLANKLYQRAYIRFLDNFLLEVHETDPPAQQFGQVWKAFGRVLDTNRDEFFFTQLQFHESYLDDASKTVREIARKVMAEWVSRLIALKVLRKMEIETVFSIVIGGFTKQVKERLETSRQLDAGFLDELQEVTWDAIRAR